MCFEGAYEHGHRAQSHTEYGSLQSGPDAMLRSRDSRTNQPTRQAETSVKDRDKVSRPGQSTSSGCITAPHIQRTSTVFFSDLEALEFASQRRFELPYYGRYGTATTFELEELVASMENADKTYAVS